MSLKEKLSSITHSAIEDTAVNFSINVQKSLVEAAEKGDSELLVSLKDTDLKVVSSQSFVTAVQELLEGVNVEIIEKSTNILFPSLKAKYIRLSWND